MIRVLILAASIACVECSFHAHAEAWAEEGTASLSADRSAVSSARLLPISSESDGGDGGLTGLALQEFSLENLPQGVVAQLSLEDWQRVFPVRVRADGSEPNAESIPMAGRYRLSSEGILFEPLFGFEKGISFQAEFHFSSLALRLKRRGVERTLPFASRPSLTLRFGEDPVDQIASSRVEDVFPSADVLPENLLKFYLHFSSPMSLGTRYQYLHLIREDGSEVMAPFLQLDEELWDPEGRRMTILIDPGRIKSGLLPREEIGPALEAGKEFRLVIDSAWPDARGLPLVEAFEKRFRVAEPDAESPRMSNWKIRVPQSNSEESLAVSFPESLDHALLSRVLWIEDPSGQAVAGEIQITDSERKWQLTPEVVWRPGLYRLCVENSLEDLAGNSLGKLFEVDSFLTVSQRVERDVIKRPFQVR